MHKARRLRGQAWITFDSVAEASNALRAMQGTQLFDKPMEIQFGKDTIDIIARCEGIFVPREKRKRPVVEIPTTMEDDSEDESNHMEDRSKNMKKPNIPPPPAPHTVTLPNKILFYKIYVHHVRMKCYPYYLNNIMGLKKFVWYLVIKDWHLLNLQMKLLHRSQYNDSKDLNLQQ